MTNEALKARLRSPGIGAMWGPSPFEEAADAIERLEADNARLREANQAAAECVAAMMEECARYRDEARAALQGTSHE